MNWWCVLGLVGLIGCTTPPQRPGAELVRRSQPLLGTFVTISAYGTNRAELHTALSAAFDEFRRVDALMSIHRPDSELSRVNARAALEPVQVSAGLFEVIAHAQRIAEETAGSFDVTIRPLADLWGFIWKKHRLPTRDELEAVLPRVDYRFIALDCAQRTVRSLRPDVSLDLGGIGKGYAVDLAVEKLRQLGVSSAMVRAGGDLRVIGAPPGEACWTVQLEDPRKQGRRIKIPLRDAALSTSGNYENFFVVDGTRYSHILNPRTGLPVEGVASCTVVAPTCTESDAWATALFAYGVEQSLEKFGERFPVRFVLMPTAKQPEVWPVRQSPSFPTPLD